MTREQIATSICVLIYLAGLVGAFYTGYKTAETKGDAELTALRGEYASQLARASEAARTKEQALNTHANTLTAMLLSEKQTHATTTQQLKKEIEHVTTQYHDKADAPLQALPRCVFTGGFVRLYNHAYGAGSVTVSTTDAPGSPDAETRSSDTVDSGVSQQDLLAHSIDNGERCRGIESQLNRLIDYSEEVAK